MEIFIENAVIEVLDSLNLYADDLAIPKYNISYEQLLYSLINYTSIRRASIYLGIPESALEHRINRQVKNTLPEKRARAPWGMCLLEYVRLKRCNICEKIFSFDNFSIVKSYGSGLNNKCKTCDVKRSQKYQELNQDSVKQSRIKHYSNNKEYYVEKSAARRTKLANAGKTLILSAEEHNRVLEFYRNTPQGYHVDHIVPIEHPLVCGLHCLANLQYLPAKDNLSKSNKFYIT